MMNLPGQNKSNPVMLTTTPIPTSHVSSTDTVGLQVPDALQFFFALQFKNAYSSDLLFSVLHECFWALPQRHRFQGSGINIPA